MGVVRLTAHPSPAGLVWPDSQRSKSKFHWLSSVLKLYLTTSDPEKFSIAAIYDDECTRLTFSFENRYQGIGSSEPVKSLMFRVQLKPFANVVFSQGGDQITF